MNLFALTLLATTACGPSIRVSRDPVMPVPSGAAWTWGASDAGRAFAEKHPMVDNATVRARVERALLAEFERKGYRKVADSSQARLLVHFHLGVEERHEVVSENRPPCTNPSCQMDWGYWGRPESEPRDVAYEAGQLMVDIVDASTRKVIWRGVLEDDFVKGDVEEAALSKSVRRLCSKLPGR
jgi:hypothetical protein